jgi:hypothetical protein
MSFDVKKNTGIGVDGQWEDAGFVWFGYDYEE